VRQEQERGNRYAVLRDHVCLARLIAGTPQHERCFHEVLLDGAAQKPRADIDIDDDTFHRCKEGGEPCDLHAFGTRTTEAIVRAFVQVLDDLLEGNGMSPVDMASVVLLTSHAEHKFSAHVVFDRLMHSDQREAKALHAKVVRLLPSAYAPCLDAGVYSANQCMRIVGSHKLGDDDRELVFCDRWLCGTMSVEYRYAASPVSDHQRNVMRLGASLLTACIDCRHVPNLGGLVAKRSAVVSSITVDVLIANDVLDLLGEQRQCFVVESIVGSMVCLRRRKKSMCPICSREHSSSSPFIVVRSDRSAWFHCRRDETSGPLCLGYVAHNEGDDDESPLIALSPFLPSPQKDEEGGKETTVPVFQIVQTAHRLLDAARTQVLPLDVSIAMDGARRRERRKKAHVVEDRTSSNLLRSSILSRLEARLNRTDASAN
jgi:hypothetical protein